MEALPASQQIRFFVYIVESPSALDIYRDTSEGTLVKQAVALDGIPCVVKTGVNEEMFTLALHLGLPEEMRQNPGHVPIVHLSAHGDRSGLQLTSGQIVDWFRLRELLRPLGQTLSGFLLVCMSACESYGAVRMAMKLDADDHPYYALIANHGKPTWGDTAVAYSTFYHRLSQGASVPDSVAAMVAASGNACWVCETAQESRNAYAEYLRTANLTEAPTQLVAAVAASTMATPTSSSGV